MPLGEEGVFEISDVALEDQFICGVGVPVPVSGLALASSYTYFLINLGSVLMAAFLPFFFNNVETDAFL